MLLTSKKYLVQELTTDCNPWVLLVTKYSVLHFETEVIAFLRKVSETVKEDHQNLTLIFSMNKGGSSFE
jgi:hypothetical protein